MDNTKYRRSSYAADIVVPVWNQVDLAYKCIKSIEANTDSAQYHLTVIDNGSDKPTFRYWIEDNFKQINLFHLPFNHGFIRAANLGLAASLLTNSEYVLLLNSDTEIPGGDTTWLDRLIAPMQRHADVGAVGAVSDNVSGFQKRNRAESHGDNDSIGVPLLIGFCLLLRKSAIAKVGLLDERFEPGNYDDWDISIRLREAGYKLAVAESVFIHHAMHASFKELDKTERFNDLLTTNRQKLEDKWGKDVLRGVGL